MSTVSINTIPVFVFYCDRAQVACRLSQELQTNKQFFAFLNFDKKFEVNDGVKKEKAVDDDEVLLLLYS